MNLDERGNFDGVTYVTILSNLNDSRNECLEIVGTIMTTDKDRNTCRYLERC